jgi:hypothetical protein
LKTKKTFLVSFGVFLGGFFIGNPDTRSIEDETTTEERLGELEEEWEGEGGAEPVSAPPPQPESSQIVPSGMALICGLREI